VDHLVPLGVYNIEISSIYALIMLLVILLAIAIFHLLSIFLYLSYIKYNFGIRPYG